MDAEQADVEAIFTAALEKRSPLERAAYLDGACGSDADLRARVEVLLKAHDDAGSFLDPPAVDPDATVGVSRPTEGPGTRIGRYKLLQVIGEGGFGAVYMAEQEQPVRRKVALKIIKLGMDTKQVIARFEAERQALAMMDHPNIARVLDAGASETGRPYFVMELVKGIPITDYCDQNNLSTKDRLDLFMPVCHAVQHAHQKGIIHRDIKPSNVMVTLHDGKPVPKVIDFGIAKATDHRLTEKTLFTEYGQFIGTPAYMSPEQAEMSGLDVDTRTDIYSLGVLLYELLTGTTPFDAKVLRQAAYGEIQRIIREVEPPKPSTRLSTLASEPRPSGSGLAHPEASDKPLPYGRGTDHGATSADGRSSLAEIAKHRRTDPSTLTRLIRGDLDWIVMKALEKDRTRRYETANELAKDLERHLANVPILASPPGAAYKFQKFIKRNRVAVTAGSLVAAALVLGLVISMIWFVQASRQRDRAIVAEHQQSRERQRAESALKVADQAKLTAIEQRERAEANNARATAAAEQAKREGAKATLMLESLQKWLVASVRPNEGKGEDLTVREMLDEAAQKIECEFADQAEIRAALLITIGQFYSKMYLRDRAEQALGEALEIRRELFGADSLEVAEVLAALSGLPNTEDADIEQALVFIRQAIEIREKLLDQDDELLLWSKGYEATFNAMLRGWDETIGPFSEWAIPKFFSQISPNEFPDETRDALVKARKLWEAGDLEGAIATVWQHVEEHIFAKTRILWATGRHEEARELVRRIYTPFLDRPLFRSHVAYNLVGTSSLLRERGEGLEGQEPFLREAVVVARAVHGDDSVRLADALAYLGRLVAERDDSTEAEALLKEAVTIYRNQVGDEHPSVAWALNRLGTALRDQGKFFEAASRFRDSLAAYRKLHGDEHTNVVRALRWLALALSDQGKLSEAEPLLVEALATCRKLVGDEDPDTLESMCSLAHLYSEQGKYDEAEALFVKTLEIRRRVLGAEHPDVANTLVSLGEILIGKRNPTDAETLLREALKIRRQALPEGHWLTANAKSILGECLTALGRYDEGELLLTESYPIIRDVRGEADKRTLEALQRIINLYEAWGKPDKATEYRAMRPAPDESSTGESGGP